MTKRHGKLYDRETFGKLARAIWPDDAEQDAELQRLLDRMGGDPEKTSK